MRLHIVILLCAMMPNTAAFSKDLRIDSQALAKFSQKTSIAKPVSSYLGSEIIATVSEQPGQSYVLTSPMNIQRAEYLLPPGASLETKQPFMKVFGPEVHHYYTQYQITKGLLEQSKLLYENSQKLFNNRALNEAQWLDISQQHFRIKLEYDEYAHFFEYVSDVDEKNESLSISAPIDGILLYDAVSSITMNSILARVVPKSSIKLKLEFPKARKLKAMAVVSQQCELKIESFEQYVQSFYQTAWTKTVHDSCDLQLGEQLSVRPLYSTQAYSLKKSAVFDWEGNSYILIKEGSSYKGVAVNIVSSLSQDYVVTANEPLNNADVLVSSISAAQGLLLGLGE